MESIMKIQDGHQWINEFINNIKLHLFFEIKLSQLWEFKMATKMAAKRNKGAKSCHMRARMLFKVSTFSSINEFFNNIKLHLFFDIKNNCIYLNLLISSLKKLQNETLLSMNIIIYITISLSLLFQKPHFLHI